MENRRERLDSLGFWTARFSGYESPICGILRKLCSTPSCRRCPRSLGVSGRGCDSAALAPKALSELHATAQKRIPGKSDLFRNPVKEETDRTDFLYCLQQLSPRRRRPQNKRNSKSCCEVEVNRGVFWQLLEHVTCYCISRPRK